jgi:hypothetical protein
MARPQLMQFTPSWNDPQRMHLRAPGSSAAAQTTHRGSDFG